MIDTSTPRLPSPASARGDTLIEVVISALLLALVVVGTLTGLNSANRTTSIDRERSQADALAQQEEDQLRSDPINKLSELSETHEVLQHEVNANGTKYLISSSARYISDATATASCSSTTPQADYIQTTSKVTWTELGKGKPVVETSLISPPPDSALIVQVTNQAGEAVPHMAVSAAGPSNESAETSSDGCAILAVQPGEYQLNVHRGEYVDPNGYENSDEDPSTNTPLYVVAEASVKTAFEFAKAGTITAHYENTVSHEKVAGDTFIATNANSSMNPAFRSFGKVGVFAKEVSSQAKVFPFGSRYTVYAGTCTEDNPQAVNSSLSDPQVEVSPGGSAEPTLPLPPISIKVLSGKSSSSPGSRVAKAMVTLEDTGCGAKREAETASPSGELTYPAPYGKYKLCVTGGSSGVAANRKYTTTFINNTPEGPSEAATMTNGGEEGKTAIIYLGSGAANTTTGTTCP